MLYFQKDNASRAKELAAKVREDDADCYLVNGALFKEDLVKNCQAVFIDHALSNFNVIQEAYRKYGVDGVKIHTAFKPEPTIPDPVEPPKPKPVRKKRTSKAAAQTQTEEDSV